LIAAIASGPMPASDCAAFAAMPPMPWKKNTTGLSASSSAARLGQPQANLARGHALGSKVQIREMLSFSHSSPSTKPGQAPLAAGRNSAAGVGPSASVVERVHAGGGRVDVAVWASVAACAVVVRTVTAAKASPAATSPRPQHRSLACPPRSDHPRHGLAKKPRHA